MSGAKQGRYRFRVSDALDVPLRGRLLRLRLLEGTPTMKQLAKGSRLTLTAPGGERREVTIRSHGVTGGRATQKRLDTVRELDIVVASEEAGTGEDAIGIGWIATAD